MSKNIEKDFFNWLKRNRLLDRNEKLVCDEKKSFSYQEILNILNELSKLLKENNLIKVDIMNNIDYREAKKMLDALCDNKDLLCDEKKMDLYLEIMNYYLKFIYTTYEKKHDIGRFIDYFNHETGDISNISLFSSAIYRELVKWPYMYVIVDDNRNYITRAINKGEYKTMCIPMFSSRNVIPDELKSENYKIKKVRLNIFLQDLEKDNNTNAVAVVLDPKFAGNDKVFIEPEEAFWYCSANIGCYVD